MSMADPRWQRWIDQENPNANDAAAGALLQPFGNHAHARSRPLTFWKTAAGKVAGDRKLGFWEDQHVEQRGSHSGERAPLSGDCILASPDRRIPSAPARVTAGPGRALGAPRAGPARGLFRGPGDPSAADLSLTDRPSVAAARERRSEARQLWLSKRYKLSGASIRKFHPPSWLRFSLPP